MRSRSSSAATKYNGAVGAGIQAKVSGLFFCNPMRAKHGKSIDLTPFILPVETSPT